MLYELEMDVDDAWNTLLLRMFRPGQDNLHDAPALLFIVFDLHQCFPFLTKDQQAENIKLPKTEPQPQSQIWDAINLRFEVSRCEVILLIILSMELEHGQLHYWISISAQESDISISRWQTARTYKCKLTK